MYRLPGCIAALVFLAAAAHAQGTLRIGLNEDPDILDPARSGSFVDRVVFASLCDKLIDVDAKLDFVPQLATSWEWAPDNLALTLHLRPNVTFQDGTKLDADAVRTNLERYRTAPESLRKTEVKPVAAVEVIDPQTLRLRLASSDAPLLAVLADRAGMIESPAALAKYGKDIGTHPVCAGPFSFVERVAQDHITLRRFPDYWNAAAIHLDGIVFRPVPDTTVRLVNLQSGQLDMIERMAATDAATVQANPHLRLVTSPSLAYRIILFNLTRGAAAQSPFAKDPRVREAFEKSLDRTALNQVVFNGQFIPSNQVEAPGNRYFNPVHPVPERDVAGAKALLAQAGYGRVPLTLIIGTDPVDGQIGQVIQSMAGEAGFDVKLQAMEANTIVAAGKAGDFEAELLIWSGRPDPDGNVAIWLQCDGFLNWGGYCSKPLDALLAQGRALTDPAQRIPVYRQAADIYLRDRPLLVLYHYRWLWGITDRLHGFAPQPDGLIRPQGMALSEH